MNLNRYEFSKESFPELLEFVKTARNVSHTNPLSTKWENYLPKNTDLENEISKFEANKANQSVIDLTQGDEPDVPHEVPSENNAQEALVVTSVDDLVVLIEENLTLSDEIITKLGSECPEESVQTMFSTFSETLDIESVCKLGNSIIPTKSAHRSTVALYFCKFILMPKLLSKSNREVTSLFLTFLNDFPGTTSQTFSENLQGFQGCPKNLQSNLQSVPNNQKQTLLRELIRRITSLEGVHIEIIDCLLTGGVSMETFQKLMELLTNAGSCFASNKLFGKMLLNLVSNNSENARHFEDQLRHIISSHRSVWKGKVQKALEVACTMDSNNSMLFSQTLRY